MQKHKTIIFDFDGTIVDSLKTIIRIYQQHHNKFKCRNISDQEAVDFRQLHARAVLRELNIPWWRLARILKFLRQAVRDHMHAIEVFKDIPSQLERLHAEYTIGILSSNSVENILKCLQSHQLDQYIDFIASEPKLFGKARALRKVIKKHKLTDTIYIGDEVRDIEAAKACNVKSIAVSWGYNTANLLESYHPDSLIHAPNELTEKIDQLFGVTNKDSSLYTLSQDLCGSVNGPTDLSENHDNKRPHAKNMTTTR